MSPARHSRGVGVTAAARRPSPAAGSTTVDVRIVDPRVDDEPEGWSAFFDSARLQPVWDYRLLRLEAWTSRNPPVLAVVRDGGQIVGGLSAMVCSGWNDQSYARVNSVRSGRLRPRWAEVYLPLLSGYPGCVLHTDAKTRRDAIRRFERELLRYLGFGLLGVMYRAMTADLAAAMSGRGRMVRQIDPAAVLTGVATEADWRALVAPDLLRTLDGISADSTIETTAAAGRDDLDPHELTAMLNAHRARQDGRAWAGGQRARVGGLHMDTRSPIAPSYLDELVRRKDVITRTYRRSGRLLGFNTMIDHPQSAAVHHWAALPRAEGGQPGLYVDAYARCVRKAVEGGNRELTAGRAMLPEKADLGFGTRDLFTVAVPRPVLGR